MSEQNIEKRLSAIEQRNAKIEIDKAWETSWVRKLCVMGLTYTVVFVYLSLVIKTKQPYFDALVPVVGYFLSTLVLRFVRRRWEATH